MLTLTTDRLLIIPCSIHIAKAVVLDDPYLEQSLCTYIPRGWPSEALKAYMPFYLEKIERDPFELGWGVWILLHPQLRTVIGDAGFKGQPDEAGMIELSYHVHADYRYQGYAFEAAHALTHWAFHKDAGVELIRAQCLKENFISMKLLDKLGMKCVRDEGSILEWELYHKDMTGL